MSDLALYRITATVAALAVARSAQRATTADEPVPYLLAMLIFAVVAIVSLRAIATYHEWRDDVAEYESRRAATGPRTSDE